MTQKELADKVWNALQCVQTAYEAVEELDDLTYPFRYTRDSEQIPITRNQYGFFNAVDSVLDRIEQAQLSLAALHWGLESSSEEEWKTDALALVGLCLRAAEADAKEDDDEGNLE